MKNYKITFLALALNVFAINNTNANIYSGRDFNTSDTLKHVKPISKIKPVNNFTGFEAGITNQVALKCGLSTLTALKPWFTYGFGLGVRYYYSKETTIVPVFALLQFNLPLKSKIAPYFLVKPGYALGGGFMVNPEIGISIKTSEKKYFMLGVGYEYLQVGKDYYGRFTENSIGMTLGFRF